MRKFPILGEPIDYSGDPLVDFSSIRFLDRFAFKNPKKAQSARDKKKKDREEEGSDLSDAEFESVMEKELGVHWRGNDDDEGDDFGQEDSDDEEGLDDEELDEEEGNLLSGEDEMGDEEDGDDGLEDSDDNDDKEEEYESQLESDDDDEE